MAKASTYGKQKVLKKPTAKSPKKQLVFKKPASKKKMVKQTVMKKVKSGSSKRYRGVNVTKMMKD